MAEHRGQVIMVECGPIPAWSRLAVAAKLKCGLGMQSLQRVDGQIGRSPRRSARSPTHAGWPRVAAAVRAAGAASPPAVPPLPPRRAPAACGRAQRPAARSAASGASAPTCTPNAGGQRRSSSAVCRLLSETKYTRSAATPRRATMQRAVSHASARALCRRRSPPGSNSPRWRASRCKILLLVVAASNQRCVGRNKVRWVKMRGRRSTCTASRVRRLSSGRSRSAGRGQQLEFGRLVCGDLGLAVCGICRRSSSTASCGRVRSATLPPPNSPW